MLSNSTLVLKAAGLKKTTCFVFHNPSTALINYAKIAALGLSIGCLGLSSGAFASNPIITTFVQADSLGPLRIDSAGNMYTIASWGCSISKITPAGVVSNVAGNGNCGYAGNGGLATNAQISGANNIALDSQDNLYIADYYNHCIRKVDKNTNIISTFAGQCGTADLTGDGGLATSATLRWPHGLGIDKYDNVYIGGDEGHSIRKVHHATNIITTIAGAGGWGGGGDGGPAFNARLGTPVGINFDQNNNMVIADNGASRIRKITALSGTNSGGNVADGISGEDLISTLAGINCPPGYGACAGGNLGDGGPALDARMDQPETAIFGPDGNVYIADSGNGRVRMIDQYGIIKTVAGTGSMTVSGDGGDPLAAGLGGVFGIVFDSAGNLYLTGGGTNRIRKITFPPQVPLACSNPAVYDIQTKTLNIQEVDVPILNPITGVQTGIGVFSAQLKQVPGIEDFQIIQLNYLRSIAAHDPSHAYYQYNDGIYSNGGKLSLCVAVQQVIVLPPNQLFLANTLLYSVVMRNLAVDPGVLHVESAQLIP